MNTVIFDVGNVLVGYDWTQYSVMRTGRRATGARSLLKNGFISL